MKPIISFLLLCVTTVSFSCAQNNIFPVNGNVGIGETAPQTKLVVNGTTTTNIIALAEGNMSVGFLGRGVAITSGMAATPDVLGLLYVQRDFAIGGWSKTTSFWNGISFFINSNNGNIGIGTTTPDTRLAVNGTVHAKEVRVDLLTWPDDVFSPGYPLLSVKEINNYIDRNHHLPEIPSATEVKQAGVELGDMSAKLLKKIEELTLIIIDQNKRIEKLENIAK